MAEDNSRSFECFTELDGEENLGSVDFMRMSRGVLYVHLIYVSPEHRNRGVGTRLLMRVCQEADKLGHRIDLYTAGPDREWLKRWYEKHGFTRSILDWMIREPLSMREFPTSVSEHSEVTHDCVSL